MFFFKQKTAYEMRISDWSSDVCSSDLGRKDVRVVMSTHDNGSTDGKKIFFRPPIELGDNASHSRRLCDKRDSDKQLLCAACRIRETVLEIGRASCRERVCQ